MSRKGHYNGGGTLVGRQNTSWFGNSSGKPGKPKVRRLGLAEVQFAKFKSQGLSPTEWETKKASEPVQQKPRNKRRR